jgi:hypothetical protein
VFSVRRSFYDEMAPRFPIYARMAELIGAVETVPACAEARPLRLGADIREWFAGMGPVIKKRVFGRH